MSDRIKMRIDGREIEAKRGQTILEAAEAAGVYIPRLCWMKGLTPAGSCRVCTVKVNGRPASACTQPVALGGGRRERHRGAASSAPGPDRHALRRGQPLLHVLREERAAASCRPSPTASASPRRSTRSCSRSGSSTPRIRTSSSTATAASCAVGASAPRRSSTAKASSGSSAGVGEAHRGERRAGAREHEGPRRRTRPYMPVRRAPCWSSASVSTFRSDAGPTTTSPSARRSNAEPNPPAPGRGSRSWPNRRSRPRRFAGASAATCRCSTSTSASSSWWS